MRSASDKSVTNMTKAEKKWMAAVADLGCIVCLDEHGYVPCHVHHILVAGKRSGHLNTIGLCPTHHSSGIRNAFAVSRHPFRREFEARYGTEWELLLKTKELICPQVFEGVTPIT